MRVAKQPFDLTNVCIKNVTACSKALRYSVEIGRTGQDGAAIVSSQVRNAEEYPPVNPTREATEG
jgi:hypothetical protein